MPGAHPRGDGLAVGLPNLAAGVVKEDVVEGGLVDVHVEHGHAGGGDQGGDGVLSVLHETRAPPATASTS